jgi:hypothetical protein
MKIVISNFYDHLLPADVAARYVPEHGLSVGVYFKTAEERDAFLAKCPYWLRVKKSDCGGFNAERAQAYGMPGIYYPSAAHPNYGYAPGIRFHVAATRRLWTTDINRATGTRNEAGLKRIRAFTQLLQENF